MDGGMAELEHESDVPEGDFGAKILLASLICVVIRELAGNKFKLLLGKPLLVLHLLPLAYRHCLIVQMVRR